ncbi:MAG: hypothetical protein JWM31_3166 [Solirubrobacterales bacterium]|nr:hypothetical protein [Solirubrobacterales bacterium]
MKIAGALMALASILTVVVFVLAVGSTKDDLIGDMRSCIKRGDGVIVHGAANLGAARREIAAKELTRVRTLRKDGDTVLVLQGQRFRLLVLANDKSPSLAGDLPKTLYEHADSFPLVAVEYDPVKGTLLGCSGLAA